MGKKALKINLVKKKSCFKLSLFFNIIYISYKHFWRPSCIQLPCDISSWWLHIHVNVNIPMIFPAQTRLSSKTDPQWTHHQPSQANNPCTFLDIPSGQTRFLLSFILQKLFEMFPLLWIYKLFLPGLSCLTSLLPKLLVWPTLSQAALPHALLIWQLQGRLWHLRWGESCPLLKTVHSFPLL